MKPTTRYTKSGRINIAYQVFGSGDKDLVYIPGWISNIDLMWDCPPLVAFFEELSKVVRVILFDKRGTGLSDRVSDLSTLEDRMDDIRAVMDSVKSSKAILFGHSEGGSVSALFSATYPERTEGLITFGVFAKRRWSTDYPWAPNDDERQEVYDMISNHWGSGQMNLGSLAPSMQDNQEFMDWLARYFRSGASPSAALALTKMNTQIDIRGILDSIAVPTLLLYRTHDIDVKVQEGRYISKKIPGSKFIEFPGEDHLFWAGDSKTVLEQMIHFIQNDCTQRKYSRVLATILKIELLDPSSQREEVKTTAKSHTPYRSLLQEKIHQYLGSIHGESTSSITATFSGPSKAVHCAIDIKNIAEAYKVGIKQGLHIGEIGVQGSQEDSDITIKITDKILVHAKSNQILITNTIHNLLSGTGLQFTKYGLLTISSTRQLEILYLNNSDSNNDGQVNKDDTELHFAKHTNRNYSLLENVMQNIEDNLTNENYSIHSLSKDIGISSRQLQRKIKAITNKSPNNLIRSVRLHKAKELIIQEGKSVKEVAFLTGFGSISYFSSCFKKEFGFSPSSL